MVGWWWISTRAWARSLSGRWSERSGGAGCGASVSMMEWSTELWVVKLFTINSDSEQSPGENHYEDSNENLWDLYVYIYYSLFVKLFVQRTESYGWTNFEFWCLEFRGYLSFEEILSFEDILSFEEILSFKEIWSLEEFWNFEQFWRNLKFWRSMKFWRYLKLVEIWSLEEIFEVWWNLKFWSNWKFWSNVE